MAAIRKQLRRQQGRIRCGHAAALLGAASVPMMAHATDISWSNPAGGAFGTGGNWTGGVAPGINDAAHFQTGVNTYAVSFATNVANLGLNVDSDNVTLNLGGYTYTQNGTTNTAALVMGSVAGQNSSLTISNGNLDTNTTSTLPVVVGKTTNSSGTVTLNVGANWTIGGGLHVGESGIGVFNQLGGTNECGSRGLYLGYNAGGIGTYFLSNGVLWQLSPFIVSEYIGYSGTGTFNQSGGTNSLRGDLYLANAVGAKGTYNFSGGTLGTNGYNELIGYSGTGTFNQTGGTVSLSTGSLYLGYGGIGTYNLGNSVLSCTSGAKIYVGYSGTGTFGQTSGTNTLNASPLYVGYNTGSSGTYTLGNGLLALTNSSEYVGYSGNATFNQTGGTHQFNATSTASLYLGYNINSIGTYNLFAGTVSASNLYIGGAGGTSAGGVGILNLSGGSFSIANTFQTYNTASGTNHSGITQTAGLLTATNTVIFNAPFTQSGGTATLGSVSGTGAVSVGGGTASALLTAQGFMQSSLTINNRGTVNVGSAIAPFQSLIVSGNVNIAAGGSLALVPYPSTYTGTARAIHSIGNLIAPATGNLMSGRLDLNNHSLLIGNLNGLVATGKQIQDLVVQGYNGSPNDPATGGPHNQAGFYYSSGSSGIVSTSVNTDAASSTPNPIFGGVGSPKALVIGVADSGDNNYVNWQNSPTHDGTIPAGKTLVAMTVMGDINLDGKVDINDFNIWQAAYVYKAVNDPNFSHKPDHWAMGDITQDGVVDINDFNYWQVAYTHVSIAPPPPGYQAAVASAQSRTNARRAALASATLPGSSAAASSSASPAAVSGNVVPANNVELDVDLKTGDVVLNSGGVSVKNFVITSSGGQLMPGQSTGSTSFTIWNTVSAANPSLGGQILSSQPNNLTEALNANTPLVMLAGQTFDYGLIFPVNG